MRVAHIMYSGLGGHGSVVFSMVGQAAADPAGEQFGIVFYGIEAVRAEYLAFCRRFDATTFPVTKGAGWDPAGQRAIFRALSAFAPDVILAHSQAGFPAVLAYRLLRPTVSTVYVEHQSNDLKSLSQWVASALAPWLFRRVVVLSQEYQQQLGQRLGRWVRPQGYRVIPNGIDLGRFAPGPVRQQGETTWLGMQARMNVAKDHQTLIRTMATLPANFRLRLAGDGEDRPALEALAQSLGVSDRVEFLGMLNEQELVGFLQGLDLYVHSTRGEAMSTAIMQAQACGLPTIVSDAKGVRPQIQHAVTGWLVESQDTAAWAQAISSLANDVDLRHRLGAQSRAWAEQTYSGERMLRLYRELFADL